MTREMAQHAGIYTFSELDSLEIPEGYVFQFVPSLVSHCLRQEREIGRQMTKKEFELLRDKSAGLVVPVTAAASVTENRGYEDVATYEDYLEEAHEEPSS